VRGDVTIRIPDEALEKKWEGGGRRSAKDVSHRTNRGSLTSSAPRPDSVNDKGDCKIEPPPQLYGALPQETQ